MAKPDGLLVVPPDGELEFLHPLPVERLWGVGRVTAAKLHDRGITTVRQVAELGEVALVSMLGRGSGRHLHALAHNRDPRRVRTGQRRALDGLAARARPPHGQGAGGPRRDARWRSSTGSPAGCAAPGACVGRSMLRLRFADFTRATRSHTLDEATAHTQTILVTAQGAAGGGDADDRAAGADAGRASRSGNLENDDAIQLALPLDRQRTLDATLDDVRDRFGATAITRAVLRRPRPGIDVPLLPD